MMDHLQTAMGSLWRKQDKPLEQEDKSLPAVATCGLYSLPGKLWDNILVLAGPAACASFGCTCSEGRNLAERCSIWRTIRFAQALIACQVSYRIVLRKERIRHFLFSTVELACGRIASPFRYSNVLSLPF